VRWVATGGAETAEVDVRGFEIDAIAAGKAEAPARKISRAESRLPITSRLERARAPAELPSRRGLKRSCETLVAWA
jgi:hypothetical protein